MLLPSAARKEEGQIRENKTAATTHIVRFMIVLAMTQPSPQSAAALHAGILNHPSL
jgi:hypothetical protein